MSSDDDCTDLEYDLARLRAQAVPIETLQRVTEAEYDESLENMTADDVIVAPVPSSVRGILKYDCLYVYIPLS